MTVCTVIASLVILVPILVPLVIAAGIDPIHFGIVIVLWGGAIGGLFGFEEVLPIIVGGAKSMENRPWTVAVDNMEVEFYQDSGHAR